MLKYPVALLLQIVCFVSLIASSWSGRMMSVMRVIKRLIMSVSALWWLLMWSLSTLITPDLNMNYDHPAFHDSSNFLSRLLHYLHYLLLLLISDDGKIVCLFVFNWFDLFLSRHPIDPIPAWPIDRLLAPHCAAVKTCSDDNWGDYNNIWHPQYKRDKNISVLGYNHVDVWETWVTWDAVWQGLKKRWYQESF